MTALALGTVQFGLRYGIANQGDKVSETEARAILEDAYASGVDTLDTAIAYGESEHRLGEIGVAQWRVVSKLPAMPDSCTDAAAWVETSIVGSLQRLKLPRLHGLLLHRSRDLLGPQGEAMYQRLVAMKNQGAVGKIGVSIYDPEELDALWSKYRLDVVQAPFNIIDRRLATSGWLSRLRDAGTEVHVRSVFLQGVLLMRPAERPGRFARWQRLWDEWDRWLEQSSMTPLQACLGFALSQHEIDFVVVGVDSQKHLREILTSLDRTAAVTPPSALMSSDRDLINPLSWISA